MKMQIEVEGDSMGRIIRTLEKLTDHMARRPDHGSYVTGTRGNGATAVIVGKTTVMVEADE